MEKGRLQNHEVLQQPLSAPDASAGSEPGVLAGDVGAVELFVALGQVEDSFDQADDADDRGDETAGDDRHHQHDDAGRGISEIKFVNAEASEQNAQNSGDDFFVVGFFQLLRGQLFLIHDPDSFE